MARTGLDILKPRHALARNHAKITDQKVAVKGPEPASPALRDLSPSVGETARHIGCMGAAIVPLGNADVGLQLHDLLPVRVGQQRTDGDSLGTLRALQGAGKGQHVGRLNLETELFQPRVLWPGVHSWRIPRKGDVPGLRDVGLEPSDLQIRIDLIAAKDDQVATPEIRLRRGAQHDPIGMEVGFAQAAKCNDITAQTQREKLWQVSGCGHSPSTSSIE
jgi:hypothetical protein